MKWNAAFHIGKWRLSSANEVVRAACVYHDVTPAVTAHGTSAQLSGSSRCHGGALVVDWW